MDPTQNAVPEPLPPEEEGDEATPVKMSPIKMTPMLKVLLIGLAVLFVLVIVVLLVVPAAPTAPTGSVPSPLPSAGAQVSPLTRSLSEYAQTEEFRNFETKLTSTRTDQDNLDLTEPQLAFPLLEMNINFDD